MKDYRRSYPEFALCGLNCGLCPRYHTDGPSRCPGCGGPDFHLKRPSCSVITCSRKHGNVEYCSQCEEFPCPRFSRPSRFDSFITYRRVLSDFEKATKLGIERYRAELDRKVEILKFLIKSCNDGKRKGFYCLAVNLLDLRDLERILKAIEAQRKATGSVDVEAVVNRFNEAAKAKGIELKLRKG